MLIDGRSSRILYGNKHRRTYKAMSMIKLSSLFPIYVNNQGVTHTFLAIHRHMQRPDLQVRMVVPNCERSLRGSNIVEAIPSLLKKIYYRSANAPRGMAQKRFLKDLKDFDAAYLKYNSDIAFTYQEADLFAFPSLEEGSPLVTYEAMAHGLPILTSPMGAGGVVREGIDGLVVSPYEEDAWVEALRKLANSPDLRAKFGVSARKRAKEFTWEKVGQRRAAIVQQRLTPQLVTSGRQQDNLSLMF